MRHVSLPLFRDLGPSLSKSLVLQSPWDISCGKCSLQLHMTCTLFYQIEKNNNFGMYVALECIER